MPGLPRNPRTIPWTVLLGMATVAREHWQGLTPGERAHLQGLLRKSKGRYANLTPRDRKDLRRLVGKLDVPGMGRDLLPHARRLRGGR